MATNADGEPLVDCTGGTLVCLSKGDSARVRDVSGQYRPLEERFYGTEEGGMGTHHQRRQLEGADLGAFEVRMKGSSFTTDEARLRSTLFDLPLEGVEFEGSRRRQG